MLKINKVNHVAIVVATKHEDTYECLVVGGIKRSRLTHGGQVERHGQASACHGQLSGAAQKGAAAMKLG